MQNFEIISTIHENERSRVCFVCLSDGSMAVFKERRNARPELYKRLQALNSPYLPGLLEIEQHENTLWILEEMLYGKTLEELLQGEEPLTQDTYFSLLESIAAGLLSLHQAEPPIIYRDLKPENIILTDDGRVLLLDMDAAREYDDSDAEKTSDTVLLGTRTYAAPEQFGFSQTDARSDIYSFGIVMKEITEHANLKKSVYKNAEKILRKAAMFAPEDRYASVSDLLKDLRMLRASFIRRRFPVLIGVGVLLCALIIGGLIFYNQWKKSSDPAYIVQSTLAVFDSPDDVDDQTMYSDADDGSLSFDGYPDAVTPSILVLPTMNLEEGRRYTEIGEYALSSRENITAVYVKSSYSIIKEYAFAGDVNLTTIFLSDSVTDIDDTAFEGCEQVTIYGSEGSYAQKYAAEHDISFCSVSDEQ